MQSTGQVTEGAASVYERFFVPALFGAWAPRVADAAHVGPGRRVLDVACGTGVLAREAAGRVGAGSVVGLDVNPGMLEVARSLAPEVTWTEGRAEELPFPDGSFDAVVSQFGLMFFADRPAALREMWRVLRPGGDLAVAVWASLDVTPGYAAMVQLLERLFGAPVADELRAPYALGDPAALGALVAAGGIEEARIERQEGLARFASIEAWVDTDVRGWTLADKIDDAQHAELRREAEAALARFVEGGEVRFAHPALLVSARKP
ncbi:MAG: methyltransferase domain-containing protein [Sandaracinaceae bacterium]